VDRLDALEGFHGHTGLELRAVGSALSLHRGSGARTWLGRSLLA
jgi:hypothetical protein